MSQGIVIELRFFMVSILWGALVLLAYDLLRVLRRIIRHRNLLVTIQDLLFWIIASVFIFTMIYVNNDGIIRGFSVMGMVIGMILYHYILSDAVVMILSRGILLLLRPFAIVLKYLRMGINYLIKKCVNLVNKAYIQLKKLIKSVKILVSKNKQKKNEENKAKNSRKKTNKKNKKTRKKKYK